LFSFFSSQILYADSFRLISGDHRLQDQHILAAVDACRSLPGMRDVPLLFFPENAPGNIGEQVYDTLVRGRVHRFFITRDSGSSSARANGTARIGITPTNQLKVDMTVRMMRLVRDRGLVFSSRFMAGPGEDMTPIQRLAAADAMREKLCRQGASWELTEHVTKTGKVSTEWSGKRAGNDDVWVALLYAVFFGIEFSISDREEYVVYKRQINARVQPGPVRHVATVRHVPKRAPV